MICCRVKLKARVCFISCLIASSAFATSFSASTTAINAEHHSLSLYSVPNSFVKHHSALGRPMSEVVNSQIISHPVLDIKDSKVIAVAF